MPTLAEEIAANATHIIEAAAALCKIASATYPAVCEFVPPQLESSCALILPAALPAPLSGLYGIDPGLTNIFARQDSLLIGVRACCLWKNEGLLPVATVTGMSSKRFSETRRLLPHRNITSAGRST